jgi:lysophospholipase L1-like esterase
VTSEVAEPAVEADQRSRAERPGGTALALAIAGVVLCVALAAAWHDHLPGGHHLRTLFEPLARRDRRAYLVHAAERLTRFRRENPAVVDGSILFLGSSTIERLPAARLFPEKPCVNRGIGNQSAADLLAGLNAVLPQSRPAAFVLYTGGIDWRAGASKEELDQRVDGILERLERAYPAVPILFVGVLPERGMSAAAVLALRSANARLRDLVRKRGAVFLDVARPPITDESGALAVECSADRLHLNAEGYRHLSRWIIEDGAEVGRELAP